MNSKTRTILLLAILAGAALYYFVFSKKDHGNKLDGNTWQCVKTSGYNAKSWLGAWFIFEGDSLVVKTDHGSIKRDEKGRDLLAFRTAGTYTQKGQELTWIVGGDTSRFDYHFEPHMLVLEKKGKNEAYTLELR